MVGSVLGGNTPGLMAALMKETAARQNLEVLVIKKAQDVEKMQGEAALKLIDAVTNVSESGRVDVHV